MKKHLLLSFLISLNSTLSVAQTQQLRIAAFNIAWAGSTVDFARHVEICSSKAVDWCDSRAKGTKDAPPSAEEEKRAAACQEAFNKAAGGSSAALQVAPCNAYGSIQKVADKTELYAGKLTGLKATIDRLIVKERVQVIAFQEVKSQEVIETLLGPHLGKYSACVAPYDGFQTVGFAWDKSLSNAPAPCTPESSLAIKENPQNLSSLKTVRPGVELNLAIAGKTVTLMNVHLKSGCANLKAGSGFPSYLLTDTHPACIVLNRQLGPLEAWLEKVASRTPYFVMLGDFNRKLDEELEAKISSNEVRDDGSDPSGPLVKDVNGISNTKYLWQELSDGKPSLVQVGLSDAGGCKGFTGLDHILVSTAIANNASLNSRKIAVVPSGTKIKSSDHCPRLTALEIN